MIMAWEVHEVHERLYPDQGWTPAKAILEDEKHLHDADHPDANGWPIWHFRHSRLILGTTLALRRSTLVRSMAFVSENASLA